MILTTEINSKEIDRSALAKMIMKLFEHWDLKTEDQLALLGLAPSARASLGRYKAGEPIGTNKDQFERVGHLLGIHKNLRLLFPENKSYLYGWMTTRNRAFENMSPVDVIKDHGFMGMLMVRAYLDKARGT